MCVIFFKIRTFHLVGKSSTTELHTQEMTINQSSLLSGCFTHFAAICRPVGLSLPNADPLLQSQCCGDPQTQSHLIATS